MTAHLKHAEYTWWTHTAYKQHDCQHKTTIHRTQFFTRVTVGLFGRSFIGPVTFNGAFNTN